MKNFLMALAVLAIAAGSALAGEPETLIKGDHEHGGFGGPVVKITTFDFEPGVLVGGRGGWIMDHKLTVGGAGYGLAKNLRKEDGDYSEDSQLGFGYGGVELGFIFGSDKLIHGGLHALIGGGGLSLWDPDAETTDSGSYFVFEPELNLEFNVTKFFRIDLGLGYRLVAGDDFYEYDYLDLSGITGTLMFKFGKF